MAGIEIEGVSKRYGRDAPPAVAGIDLTVGDGELVALVGPSGCGKSTLLRMVAGLERVTEGVVRIGGRDVTHLPPKDRDIAMVFQDYALFPQMTVRKNLGFGLRARGVDRATAAARIEEVAATLKLSELLDRRPYQLSGGQRQRVAIGRAIIRDPQAFLMDEPLSNLDANLRTHMRGELVRLRRRLGVTTLYVTHDQVEAMTLGDRVVVLDHGRVRQIGRPRDLFDRPGNTFVAAVIGSPAMNMQELAIVEGAVRIGDARLSLPGAVLERCGTTVIVGIRPAEIADVASGVGANWLEFKACPDVVEMLGTETHVQFEIDGTPVVVGTATSGEAPDGLFDAGVATRVRLTAALRGHVDVRPGVEASLALRTAGVHYFDPSTGLRIDAA